jgi:transposase
MGLGCVRTPRERRVKPVKEFQRRGLPAGRFARLIAFTNKNRMRLKVLYWDKTGLWLMAKRLENGTFCWPRSVESQATHISLLQ